MILLDLQTPHMKVMGGPEGHVGGSLQLIP